MKKLKTIVTKKDGTTKEVYVVVDDRTAEMLASLDNEKMVNDYLADEYWMYMANYNEHRHTQSLDKSIEGGLELPDEKQDLMESILDGLEHEEVRKAIKQLDMEQQRIVYELFYEEKKQIDVAKELHITKQAMSQRVVVIKETLKKLLKNF